VLKGNHVEPHVSISEKNVPVVCSFGMCVSLVKTLEKDTLIVKIMW
jgi:hypothetical protein